MAAWQSFWVIWNIFPFWYVWNKKNLATLIGIEAVEHSFRDE
jgi:hypothetical protein